MKSICKTLENHKFIIPTLFDIYLKNIKISRYPINNIINLDDKIYLDIIETLEKNEEFKQGSLNTKVNENEKYELLITLKSVCVEFTERSSDSEKTFFSLYLPFIYLPLIYYLNKEEIQRYISLCIIFDKKMDKAEFDSDRFISLVKQKLTSNVTFEKHIHNLQFDWLTNSKVFEINLK